VKLKLKLIQFMYFLYVDNDEETNRRHAERMGVEVEKIRAARIMQGEVRKDELEKVDRLREKFVGGSERVITILEGLAKEYETAPIDSNTRLKSIITNLSKAFPNRFFSSPFLTLFLSTHLSEPYPVTQHLTYSFLSTILKRIPNPQLLLYKHQRPICLLLL
jgi:hypothetical protein